MSKSSFNDFTSFDSFDIVSTDFTYTQVNMPSALFSYNVNLVCIVSVSKKIYMHVITLNRVFVHFLLFFFFRVVFPR